MERMRLTSLTSASWRAATRLQCRAWVASSRNRSDGETAWTAARPLRRRLMAKADEKAQIWSGEPYF